MLPLVYPTLFAKEFPGFPFLSYSMQSFSIHTTQPNCSIYNYYTCPNNCTQYGGFINHVQIQVYHITFTQSK
jgi:hypothetical protein